MQLWLSVFSLLMTSSTMLREIILKCFHNQFVVLVLIFTFVKLCLSDALFLPTRVADLLPVRKFPSSCFFLAPPTFSILFYRDVLLQSNSKSAMSLLKHVCRLHIWYFLRSVCVLFLTFYPEPGCVTLLGVRISRLWQYRHEVLTEELKQEKANRK